MSARASAVARWILVRAAIFVALIAFWRGLIWFYAIPSYIAPQPSAVLNAVAAGYSSLLAHAAYTLGTAILGLTISGVFAVSLALACTNSPDLSRASMPLIIGFRSAPVTAIAPLIMLMVGRGMGTSVIVVTIVSFFPIFVNLTRGLAAPDPVAVELLAVTGASRWHQMRYLRLPAAMPFLFTGLRIAGGSAILGAMLSEWLTGAPGLGMLILETSDMRQIEMLWAAVIFSVLIALCVFWITSAGERAVLSWRV